MPQVSETTTIGRGVARPLMRILGGVLLVLTFAGAVPAKRFYWEVVETYGERGRGRNELREPVDVAVLPEGRVVVLDRRRDAIVTFSRSGRWIRTLGGPRGGGELRLRDPVRIETDPRGRLWVVDRGDHRVVALDEDGRELVSIGTLGSDKGRFRYPVDIAFDERGRIYVADYGNERVQVFTPDGRFLSQWRRRSANRRGHLGKPVLIAYTRESEGGVWVLSEGWTRLERFDRAGEWQDSLDLGQWLDAGEPVADLDLEPAFHRLFVSLPGSKRILVVDRRGRQIGELKGPESGFEPWGLTVLRGMEVYVTDRAGRRVLRYRVR